MGLARRNLRDLFNPVKQAPLTLESKPIESDLVIEEEGVFTSLKNSIRGCLLPEEASAAGAGVDADSGARSSEDEAEPGGDGIGDCGLRAVVSSRRVAVAQEGSVRGSRQAAGADGSDDSADGSDEGAGDGRRRRTAWTDAGDEGNASEVCRPADRSSEGPSAAGAEDQD